MGYAPHIWKGMSLQFFTQSTAFSVSISASWLVTLSHQILATPLVKFVYQGHRVKVNVKVTEAERVSVYLSCSSSNF